MPASRTPLARPSASLSPLATLVARHLSHDRGGRTVLDGVSLTVGPESRVGVVGPNGVGKSTLLQLLAGLIEPDEGQIVLDPPGPPGATWPRSTRWFRGRRSARRWPGAPGPGPPSWS